MVCILSYKYKYTCEGYKDTPHNTSDTYSTSTSVWDVYILHSTQYAESRALVLPLLIFVWGGRPVRTYVCTTEKTNGLFQPCWIVLVAEYVYWRSKHQTNMSCSKCHKECQNKTSIDTAQYMTIKRIFFFYGGLARGSCSLWSWWLVIDMKMLRLYSLLL